MFDADARRIDSLSRKKTLRFVVVWIDCCWMTVDVDVV
jgi:hypothetical protein